ncbi:class I SAM-dependent methyltransferase [Candidatus Pacearchaeota archaeon]|nr:class I SAM-dependent methyltransferase [Candidatus Pacearchaeota archaeon]
MAYIPGQKTNRPFFGYRGVNAQFGMRLGDEIEARLGKEGKITVLDIACGTEAEAITELTMMHENLTGIGLDYSFDFEKQESARLSLMRRDIFDLKLESVADVAYCAFLFADIFHLDREDSLNEQARATFQIAKTLKPNGIAYIDEGAISTRQYWVDKFARRIEGFHPGFMNKYQITNNPELGVIGNHLLVRSRI